MSKLAELYAKEITKDAAIMTIDDVPTKLREQVAAAVAEIQGQNGGA